MRLLNKYLIHLPLLLIAWACNPFGDLAPQDEIPGLTVTPGAFEITVLVPDVDGSSVSSRLIVSGDCGKPGYPIEITGAVNLYTICQDTYHWNAPLSLQSLSDGSKTINVKLREKDLTGGSPVVSRSFEKIPFVCTDENRGKLFANIDNGGNGTSVPYQICTAVQFANIAVYPSRNYELADNVDFASIPFNPIPVPFTGTLDGSGFNLENIYISKAGENSVGLFKYLQGATIRDLGINDAYVEGNIRVGILAGDWRGSGTIQNVKIKGSANGVQMVGAVAGLGNTSSNLNITNLNTEVDIQSNDFAGGVVGYINTTDGGFSISNSVIQANVTGKDFLGGVVGRLLEPNVSFNNVEHRGNINSVGVNIGGLIGESSGGAFSTVGHIGSVLTPEDATDVNVGGLFGHAKGNTIINGANVTSNISSGGNYNGGIAGRMYSGSITNSVTRGTITINEDQFGSVTKFVGGVVGNTNFDVTISNAENYININATSHYVGGLVGFMGGPNSSIDSSHNNGAISARTSFVGGLVGQFAASYVRDSFNTGNIDITNPTPNANIGGVIGYSFNASSVFENLYNSGNILINNDLADNVGGIFGQVQATSLTKAYNTGNITGSRNNTGGIVGFLRNTPIDFAFSSGNINANFNYAGGIAGLSLGSAISNVFSSAVLTAHSRVGGLVGWHLSQDSASLSEGYFLGAINKAAGSSESDSLFGAIVGEVDNNSFLNNLYYLDTITNVSSPNSEFTSALSNSDLTAQSNYGGFLFSGDPNFWTMAPGGFILPDGSSYDKAIFNWMTNANYGFTVPQTFTDDPINDYFPGVFDNQTPISQGFDWTLYEDLLDIAATPVSNVTVGNLELTIEGPAANGEIISTTKLLWGECGISGAAVRLSGDFNFNTICQSNNRWATLIDASSLGNGIITVNVNLLNPADDNPSPTVTRTFSKTSTLCGDEANRNKIFANIDTGGDGAGTPYVICNPGQFKNIEYYADSSFVLENDIDFTGNTINPFANTFTGSIDGNGFKVRNYIISKASSTNVGLFSAAQDATFRNLNLENVKVTGNSQVGGLVGSFRGTGVIENVQISGTVTGIIYTGGLIGIGNTSSALDLDEITTNVNVTGNGYTGGVIGMINTNDGSFNADNITINSSITGLEYVGGLAGRVLEPNAVVNTAAFNGSITAYKDYIGGLFGQVEAMTISNASGNGTVNAELKNAAEDRGYIGGLIGSARVSLNMSLSSFSGNINAGSSNVGGLFGHAFQGSFSNLNSSANINVNESKFNGVTYHVGGIAGLIEEDSSADSLTSTATINATSRKVGGVAGRFAGKNSTWSNSSATGNVTARTDFVGGLAGIYDGSSLTDSFATGDVSVSNTTPDAYLGGLLGYANGKTVNFSGLYATGDVVVTSGLADYVGGLFGYFRGGTLTNSYSHGNVSGARISSGGFIGLSRGTILNSFSTGNVECSSRHCGGFVGYVFEGSIFNSFATGNVEANEISGGLVGFVNTTATNTVSNSYAFGTVSQISGGTGSLLTLGSVMGDEQNLGSLNQTNTYYILENVPVGQNSNGSSILTAASGSEVSYANFNFAGASDWTMPPTNYILPNTLSFFNYPIPDWLISGGSGSGTGSFYTISGNVSGHQYGDIVLELTSDSGIEEITISYPNTSFSFGTPVEEGTAYEVALVSSPENPGITCATSGTLTGNMGSENLTDIVVTCPTFDSLIVSASRASMSVGDAASITVRGLMSDASVVVITDQASISSTNSGILTVTGSVATAVGQGLGEISASFLGLTNTVNINILDFPNAATNIGWQESSPHGDTSITANWNISSSTDLSTQTIQVFEGNSCTSSPVATVNLSFADDSYSYTGTMGNSYYFNIISNDSEGLSSTSVCSSEMLLDADIPDGVSNVQLSQIWMTGSLPITSPTISWTNPTSTFNRVEVALGSSAGSGDLLSFQNAGSAESISFSNLFGITECVQYFATVRTVGESGTNGPNVSSSLGFRLDNTLPGNPNITNIGSDGNENAAPTITFDAASDNCGIRFYEVAIGTTPGGTDIQNYTSIGTNTSFQAQNGVGGFSFSLTPGVDYYTSVRSVDFVFLRSSSVSSSAWQIQQVVGGLSNLVLWLDAGDNSTIIDTLGNDADNGSFNGNVATWVDKSGSTNQHDFTPVSSNPTFDSLDPKIVVNATNPLTTTSHSDLNLNTTQSKNISVAFRTSTDINSPQVIYEEGGGSRGMNIYISAGKLYCGFWNTFDDGDGAQPFTYINSNIAANSTYNVTWNFDYTNYTGPSGADGTLECFVNGISIGTAGSTSRLFDRSGDLGLGGMKVDTNFDFGAQTGDGINFHGSLLEVIVSNDTLASVDINNIQNYLISKWSGAELSTPSNLFVLNNSQVNETATFNWDAVPSPFFTLDHYEIALGTTPGGQEVFAFTDVGSSTSYKGIDGVNGTFALTEGVDYYFSVKAIDVADNESLTAISESWQVFDPNADLPDMIVWLDAKDSSTLEDASGDNPGDGTFDGSITNLRDKSGSANTHDFFTMSGAGAPTYDSSNEYINFDGTQAYEVNNHAELNTATVNQRNITVAFKTGADVTSRQNLYEEGGGVRGMNVYISSGQLYCGFWNLNDDGDGAQPFVFAADTIQPNTIYYVTWVFDYTNYIGANGPDGTLDCYVNSQNIGSLTSTSLLYGHAGRIGLGGNRDNTVYHDGVGNSADNFFSGDILEFIITNDPPNSTTVTALHDYLGDKWGTNTSEVTISNIAIVNNASATQSATATWSIPDPFLFNLDHYKFGIGTTPTTDDVLPFFNIGTSNTYQAVNGVQGVTLNLVDGQDYYILVKAIEVNGSETAVIASEKFGHTSAKSCMDHKLAGSTADTDYLIDPDGLGGENPIRVFCYLMNDPNGGWTLISKYDSAMATSGAFSLPTNAMRENINISGMEDLAPSGVLASTINAIPLITNGATELLHASMNPGDGSFTYRYRSEIYQAVIDTPDNFFNPALDTNANENVAGTIVQADAALKNRWFEFDGTPLSDNDLQNANAPFRIDGGEGNGMWTNGSREGALYASHNNSSATGHSSPVVQWGFRGKDGTQQNYGASVQPHVGTHFKSNLSEPPALQMNYIFIK